MSAFSKRNRGDEDIEARFSGFPAYVNLSTTQMQSSEELMICLATAEPMKPAPPVIRILFIFRKKISVLGILNVIKVKYSCK
jgi:hypothetical protein